MKRCIVHSATLVAVLAATVAASALAPAPARAGGIPDNKIVVVRIKAIDGLDKSAANIQVNRTEQFVRGGRLHVSRSAVSSLDGVKTLVLVERRNDAMSGADLVQTVKLEASAVNGDMFSVTDADGKKLNYGIDILNDGSVDLLGPKDRIVVREGAYQIWKIESASLVSRDGIDLY